jgi:hypothetical protein
VSLTLGFHSVIVRSKGVAASPAQIGSQTQSGPDTQKAERLAGFWKQDMEVSSRGRVYHMDHRRES